MESHPRHLKKLKTYYVPHCLWISKTLIPMFVIKMDNQLNLQNMKQDLFQDGGPFSLCWGLSELQFDEGKSEQHHPQAVRRFVSAINGQIAKGMLAERRWHKAWTTSAELEKIQNFKKWHLLGSENNCNLNLNIGWQCLTVTGTDFLYDRQQPTWMKT